MGRVRVKLAAMVQKRMTGQMRREQLIEVGRAAFAELGFDGAGVEEIAHRAGVSKPVVYEHFGGKEGLYAVVIDREMRALEDVVMEALVSGSWKQRIEKAALALLTYVDEQTDGFVILVRDSKRGTERSYSTLLNAAVNEVSYILAEAFEHRGLDAALAPLYAQALVGMVANTAQWWLDVRSPAKEEVAAHIVNLSWHGLRGLQQQPKLSAFDSDTLPGTAPDSAPEAEPAPAPPAAPVKDETN